MNFDIDRYKQLAARLDDSDIDYDHFRSHPLPEPALRCLRYMNTSLYVSSCPGSGCSIRIGSSCQVGRPSLRI